MSFLDGILETKRREVALLKQSQMSRKSVNRPTRSLRTALMERNALGVIAEIKRRSPSKGLIQADVDPVARAQVYSEAGVAAISILTDREYFGGSIRDLQQVREHVDVPLLRKDFIIDEVQIDEAYQAGADVVLLIAAALSKPRLIELSTYAQGIGLDVLLEVHEEAELDAALAAKPSVLGVNNRDLHTFQVDLATTERVLQQVPKDVVAIAESGVFTREDAGRMARAGASGVLVGESLMRHAELDEVSQAIRSLQVELVPSEGNE